MRILLVEDDELLGSAIQDALTRGAYGVEWVRDGRAGFDALQTGGFDLVVLDLGLPQARRTCAPAAHSRRGRASARARA